MADVVLEKNVETTKKKSKGPKNPVVATEKRELIVGKKVKRYETRTFKNGVRKTYLLSCEKATKPKKQKKISID